MRRDKLDILRDILMICGRQRARKTEIAYKSNINFTKLSSYLNWLVAHGFLEIEGSFFEITPAGLSLLSSLEEIEP